DAYNNKGAALYDLGRYGESIKCFDKILELDDKNINAYNNKGAALSKLDRNEEAIECYNKALELDDKNINAYNNKGIALYNLNRNEEAIECYNKALKLDNKNIDSLKNKLECLYKLNDYKNIISCIDDILKIHDLFDSDYIEELKLKKADYIFYLEDYKRALKSYEELKTDDFKIKEKIIICFMKLNNFQKAQKYISKLIANNKNNELYYYRGICLFNTNKYQECIKDFDTVIDYEDSKFYKGLSLHYLGDNDEALSLITEYKNKNEEDYSKKYNKFKEVIDKILIQYDKSDSAEKTDN
ncbi:tetratricopeptide repeat protein, partial [Brachyspira intermedia]|uniref:tetratricopeptide repeat protein n=1 Tax=Brachyspira intermedia TaxID=84377 RepID=UPI00300662A7